MTREELIVSPEYWIVNFQNELFCIVSEYMKDKKLSIEETAKRFEISKSSLRRILNGDGNESLTKVCQIFLKCGYIPKFKANITVSKFLLNDKNKKS